MMIGSGNTTNTRRAIHGVDIVAGKEESVAIEKSKLILEIILTPTSCADIESIMLIK